MATTTPSIFEQSLFCYLDICSVLTGSYGPAVQTVGIVLFVLVFNFFIKKVLFKLRNRFNKTGNIWAWSFVSALPKPLNYYVWYVAGICSIDNVASSLAGFHLMNIDLVLIVGGILCFCWFLLRWNGKIMHAMIERSQSHLIPLEPGKVDLIGKVVTISIIFVAIFILMDLTGHNMQTLITFGGIGGLAIAFASQQMVSNFFGGVMIYMTRPFTIGEKISLPSHKIEGYVEEIGWYTTRVRSLEKQPIYLPNSIFTQTVVITPSRMTHERFHYTIGLRHQDVALIPQIVDAVKLMLLKHPYLDQNMPIDVCFINFSPGSLDIEISAYVESANKSSFKSIRQELLLKINQIIVSHGAQIPTNDASIVFPNGINIQTSSIPAPAFISSS